MARQWQVFTVRADGLNGKKVLEFESTIIGMLRFLDSVASGHALLDGFRTYGRPILVVPYDGSEGDCNAVGGTKGGMYYGQVWFTARDWFATSRCFSTAKAGVSAHETLVHELTHALRAAARTFGKGGSGAEEEVIAILVQNIFSSETGRPLRKEHASFAPLTDPVLSTSLGFLNANRALIERFAKQHPNITRWLARGPAPFNPLREYWGQVPVSAGGWKPGTSGR